MEALWSLEGIVSFFFKVFKLFLKLCAHVYICVGVCTCYAGTHGDQKRELDPLWLKNRQFCLWVLGGEHRSSAREVHAFNYGVLTGPPRMHRMSLSYANV